MSRALLLSVAFIPILVGMMAASARGARRGLVQLLVAVVAFDLAYALFLYYVYLRIR